MKEGIFVGPQIWEVLKNPTFEKTLAAVERCVWKAFEWLCANLLGNTMSPLFQEEIKNLLKAYKNMDYCMSLKVHFYTYT